ncbi:MAG: hypothetical protein MRECE_37c007 [Mycoplasmataceae bacterium CE_OT135]|nr:MAG: hypothetical protein MRECE_37c007 [Mycoplasmataceae bacterium CE_OT135]
MNKQKSKKKKLAAELKAKLNSPDYVAVSELLEYNDRYGDMFPFIYGRKVNNSVHSEERDNWILDMRRKEKEDKMIYEHELEPTDWEEIINLIETRNKEKEENFNKKRNEILERLNNQNNLYYYWSDSYGRDKKNRATCWVEYKGMRGYVTFMAKENGREYGLYIAENHPILDEFPFKRGFYVIDTDKPIEYSPPGYESDGGKENPNNFHKWVEADDEITITLEDGEKLVAKEANRKQNTLNNKTMAAAGSAKGNLTAVKSKSTTPKENNLTAQSQNSTNIDNKQLTQILQKIQEIEAKIAKLEQTKTNSQQIQKLNQELQALEAQKQTLSPSPSSTENQNNSNSKLANDTNPTSPNSTSLYLIGGLVIFGISALAIGYFLGKKRKKSS